MKNILLYLITAIVALGAIGCIEDGITTSPSAQPTFSTDTLDMGLVFTDDPTATHAMTVYNRHDKGLMISSISLSGENARYFRLNVDGFSGRDFSNVEIRAKDSIYVMVEATLPPNGADLPMNLDVNLDFVTNGVKQSVVIAAQGQDVERLKAVTIDKNTRFDLARPYQIFDSLVVAEGTTLTLAPGTRLCFHDGARMVVRGTLRSEGTAEKPIMMTGDRRGNVVTDISFDIMSRQWDGLWFTHTSRDNDMRYTTVRNTVWGVTVDSITTETDRYALSMLNCVLTNSASTVLDAYHSNIKAVGCEFSEGGGGLVALHGGSHIFNYCTIANNYLFSVIGGPGMAFSHTGIDDDDDGSGLPFTSANITNTIIHGLGTELSHGDLTGSSIYLRRCLLKTAGEDDDNFINCLWDTDPLFYTVREEYIFDYRLRDESPAIGAADAALTRPEAATDRYGLSRGTTPDIGAYVYTSK